MTPFVVDVQSLSPVQLFANPWIVACQASLSFTVSWSLLKLMFIESDVIQPSSVLHYLPESVQTRPLSQ